MSANREYKSSVFTALFSDPDKIISLYNAIAGCDLPLDTPITIATLEDILFTDRRNDIAFVLDDKVVVLAEHQSSINENMPLRLLIYIARVFEKIIDNDAVYKQKLLKIPKPDFIVLYNGLDPFPDEKVLRLSDAYGALPAEYANLGGLLELEVRVININEGRNEPTVNRCEYLRGYVQFVGKVRTNINAGEALTAAVTKAVKDCIAEGILKEFLNTNASEVSNMLTTEWNAERYEKVIREEGREEKALEIAVKALALGLTNDMIVSLTGLTTTEVELLRTQNLTADTATQ